MEESVGAGLPEGRGAAGEQQTSSAAGTGSTSGAVLGVTCSGARRSVSSGPSGRRGSVVGCKASPSVDGPEPGGSEVSVHES